MYISRSRLIVSDTHVMEYEMEWDCMLHPNTDPWNDLCAWCDQHMPGRWRELDPLSTIEITCMDSAVMFALRWSQAKDLPNPAPAWAAEDLR